MTYVEFSADTNNRSVNRSDGYNPELHESTTHGQLMEVAESEKINTKGKIVNSGPPLPEASDIGGTQFDRHQDYGPDESKPKPRRRNPRYLAIGGVLQDLKNSQHGWVVDQFRDDAKQVLPCPYCDGPMYPVVSWYCECTLETFTPGSDSGCRCNWCVINRTGYQPGAGRPRSHCGKPACAKDYRKQKNREAYQRRKGNQAA